MVLNTALIFTFGRPRKFKKDKRPLIEPSAFKEPVYLLYAIGIFFTLWGLYIAYFYVSRFLASQCLLSVATDEMCAPLDIHVRSKRHWNLGN